MGYKRLWLSLVTAVALQLAGCGDEHEPEAARCGDGNVDEGEACDDGNGDDGDACRNTCTVPACGDGILDNDEACDDGNDVDDDACRVTCILPACGDGVLDPLEACDEGDANSEDADAACRTNCRAARCGDGVLDASAGEVCDDGNLSRGDGCAPDCLSAEVCGNGVVDPDEQCDDGNLLSNDGCASNCVIESPRWTLFTDVPPPEIFEGYIQVFDANRGQLLRFTDQGTMALDSRGWRKASNTTPLSAYTSAVCANDVSRARVVCYAFTGLAGHARTYTWDGVTWTTEVQDTPAPPPRSPGAFVYDPIRQRIVMFGGTTGTPLFEQPVFYDDTWEWDGERWTQVAPPTTPDGFQGEAAFHPVMGKVVLLMGNAVAGEVDDTYTYDGTDWTRVADTLPSEAQGRMRWEPTTQELVLDGLTLHAFDGSEWIPSTTPSRNEQTEYFNGSEWVTTTPTVPVAQHSIMNYWSAAYIPTSGKIMLAGGALNSNPAPFNVVPETQQTRLYGSSGWSYGPTSPASMHPALAYDPTTNHLMLIAEGTFLWDGAEWMSFSDTGPSEYVSIAWDPVGERMIRFGGMSGPFVFEEPGDPPPPALAEGTQYWDGNSWTAAAVDASPQSRWLAHMLLHPAKGQIFMYGGIGVFGSSCCGVSLTAWQYDGGDVSWTTDEEASVHRRIWNDMTYDPHRASFVEFGGNADSGWYFQTYELRDGDFEQLAASGPEVTFPAMAFHALHRRTTLFDGHDVWEFGYGPVREMCVSGLDGDDDGLVGCEDPDCWGYCNPECPPGAACPTDADRCGDGTCNDNLETSRLCPQDCNAPTAICGDFLCDAGETPTTCPGDCQ